MVALTADVLQDDVAVSLARVMAMANKRARELGVDVLQSMITVTQQPSNGLNWLVNYGSRNYINQRGGDLMIEINGEAMKIEKVLRGQ